MKSITINMTKKLRNNSNYFDSYFRQFKIYGKIRFKIPDDVDVKLFNKLIRVKVFIFKENDTNFDDILYIVDYFQLNNVLLKLRYDDLSEYNQIYNDINKTIIITNHVTNEIVHIPQIVNHFHVGSVGILLVLLDMLIK